MYHHQTERKQSEEPKGPEICLAVRKNKSLLNGHN